MEAAVFLIFGFVCLCVGFRLSQGAIRDDINNFGKIEIGKTVYLVTKSHDLP